MASLFNNTGSLLSSDSSLWKSSVPIAAIGFLGYAGVCSALRFRRINRLQRKLKLTTRESLAGMTNDQAHEVVFATAALEFPLFFELSLRVALFRTYAVDNIGLLLAAMSDLRSPKAAPKRYEDTEILFSCFFKFPPNSPLLHNAVARMNYLHRPYIQAGKILNKDFLYVLYASAYEPVRFMRLYEWRSLTDMEVAALAQLWKYVGDMMDLDYEAELGKSTWKDGIEFLDDLAAWGSKYEDEYLKARPEFKTLGQVLMDMQLSAYPSFVRPAGYTAISVLMGERLRHAFGIPEPGIGAIALVHSLLLVRQTFLRYFALPRIFEFEQLSDPDEKTGRIIKRRYLKEPWYNAGTFWARWGPVAIISRLSGVQVPGDAEMKPEGFKFEDIGPLNKMGKGIEEAGTMAAEAKARVSGNGCPFSAGK